MGDTQDNAGNILIGTDVTIQGVLVVPNRAVVNGAIEGEVTAKELVVGPTGRIVGHARTERADIHGQVHKTLEVSQSLVLRSTGRVVGLVQYRELEIERGGLVEGTMNQIPAQEPSRTPPPPAPLAVQDDAFMAAGMTSFAPLGELR